MPYEVRFETDPGEQAQVDFAQFQAEFGVEPGRRRRQKRTILCVPNKVYDANSQKFSTLGLFLVLICLTLFSTGFVPAAHADQFISIIQAPKSVNEGDSFRFQVRRTASDGDNYNESLQIELKIAPVSPIEGFNILSGGDDTDGLEQTITFNAGERGVWKTVQTLDNDIVNDDVQIRITMKATDNATQANKLNVLVFNDEVYTLKVNLVTVWQRYESENIQVKFLRCVGKEDTETIKNCHDANGSVRAGASTAALTEEIFVEKLSGVTGLT